MGILDLSVEVFRPALFVLVVVPCVFELLDRVGAESVEPIRDLTARMKVSVLAGEGAALGSGGDVGAVDGDDGIEDVACFGDVVSVGNDADHVVLAAASHGDVQVAAGRCAGGEFEAGGDGVGLGAHLGRRVAEPDMVVDVVGGEGDLSVSCDWGDGEIAVVVGLGDGPQVTVADPFPAGGGEVPLVAGVATTSPV